MCGPCGRGTSGSGAAVPRPNTGGSVRSRCPAAMTNAGISGSAAAPRHSARSCARLPLPRKTLLPLFSRNPCLSHMAKGQGTPQGGDGFIKYLADDRTCLPAHRLLLLLETFPALTASLRRGSASRSRGQSWLLPGTVLPPGTIQAAPALLCACRNRERHRSLVWPPGAAWAPPGLGEPGVAGATPVLVRVTHRAAGVALVPLPCPMAFGMSPSWH